MFTLFVQGSTLFIYYLPSEATRTEIYLALRNAAERLEWSEMPKMADNEC